MNDQMIQEELVYECITLASEGRMSERDCMGPRVLPDRRPRIRVWRLPGTRPRRDVHPPSFVCDARCWSLACALFGP